MIYTYGLMLAIGLALGISVLCIELRRKRVDPLHGIWVALIAIVGGVLGSRLLFIAEEWKRFVAEPIGVALLPGGLSFYGGLLLGALAIYPYLRSNGISFLAVADAAAPGALLARGVGRLGCHLSGDGDYGLPTSLPWGTDYANGIYPPSRAVARLPELASTFPGGIAPDHLRMHPTGVYEFLISVVLFAVFWRFRCDIPSDGRLFMIYLVATGATRFSLEFIALAPPVAFGLTEAQLISVALIMIGAVGAALIRVHARRIVTSQ